MRVAEVIDDDVITVRPALLTESFLGAFGILVDNTPSDGKTFAHPFGENFLLPLVVMISAPGYQQRLDRRIWLFLLGHGNNANGHKRQEADW